MAPTDESLHACSPSSGAAAFPRPASVPRRVLLVDDDPDALELAAETLIFEGWEVSRAASGREALALAADAAPDVMVIDLQMPRMDGRELCEIVRRDPALARTRILVVSGADDARWIAAECHADGAVTKPFAPDLLRTEVRRLLGV